MGNKVTFDYSKASTFVAKHEVDYMSKLAMDAKELLLSRKGAGNDFLGWIDLPVDYDKEEFDRIKKAAAKILTFCWSSVSVVLIWEPELQLNF